MTEQIIEQSSVETPQPTPEVEQSESSQPQGSDGDQMSIRRYRHQREGGRPKPESRRPYAHADQPSQADKWQAGESEGAPSKGGFQRRIDKLVREKSELERQLTERQGTPQKSQWESIDEMTARVLRERAESERASVRQTEAQPQPQKQTGQFTFSDKYVDGMKRLKESKPDLEAVLGGIEIPDYINDQLQRMENGPQIVYDLAKNKQALKKILDLNAAALARGDGDFSQANWEFGDFVRSLNSTAKTSQPQAQNTELVARAQTLRQQLEAATRTDPEFADAVKNNRGTAVPRIVYPAMLNLPNSRDVAIYLTKRPQLQQQLLNLWQTSGNAVWTATRNQGSAMHAANVAVIAEMHRISAALQYGTTIPQVQRVERPVSQAPAPITPVGGSGSAHYDGDSEGTDVDITRYRSYRNRQRSPRRG